MILPYIVRVRYKKIPLLLYHRLIISWRKNLNAQKICGILQPIFLRWFEDA